MIDIINKRINFRNLMMATFFLNYPIGRKTIILLLPQSMTHRRSAKDFVSFTLDCILLTICLIISMSFLNNYSKVVSLENIINKLNKI